MVNTYYLVAKIYQNDVNTKHFAKKMIGVRYN